MQKAASFHKESPPPCSAGSSPSAASHVYVSEQGGFCCPTSVSPAKPSTLLAHSDAQLAPKTSSPTQHRASKFGESDDQCCTCLVFEAFNKAAICGYTYIRPLSRLFFEIWTRGCNRCSFFLQKGRGQFRPCARYLCVQSKCIGALREGCAQPSKLPHDHNTHKPVTASNIHDTCIILVGQSVLDPKSRAILVLLNANVCQPSKDLLWRGSNANRCLATRPNSIQSIAQLSDPLVKVPSAPGH